MSDKLRDMDSNFEDDREEFGKRNERRNIRKGRMEMKATQTVKVVGVSESTSQTHANKIFTGGKIQATKAREVILVNRFKKVGNYPLTTSNSSC